MSFDNGSGHSEDRQSRQQLNGTSGPAYNDDAAEIENISGTESPEIIEDDDSVESFDKLDDDEDVVEDHEEEDDDVHSDESHPEAAEALRALQKYRGEQQEPSASDYYSDDSMADEGAEQDNEEEDKDMDLSPDHNSEDAGNFHQLSSSGASNGHHRDREHRSKRETQPKRSEDKEPIYNLLKGQVQELEIAHRELQRQLHRAQLEAESARAAQQRQSVVASLDAEELRSLRASTSRERAEMESRIAELRADSDTHKVDADAKERAYRALRDRFNQQAVSLAEVRAQVIELQRERVQFEVQVTQATRAETRAQKQLEQLRAEFDLALDEASQARAELELQTKTLTEVRTQAKEEALRALAQDVESTAQGRDNLEEGLWRSQYIELRKQMDDVAAEFERREPEILALQEAHEQAEDRLAEAAKEAAVNKKQKDELERKLRSAERRVTDLTVQQQLTETTLADLRRQLLVLLTEKLLDATQEARLSPDEEDELAKLREEVARNETAEAAATTNELNGQKLITERLLLFKDVAELQFQNEALLKACRELASQLDPSGDATAAALAAAQHSASEDIQAATEALESLQQKYKQLREELTETLSRETNAKQLADEATAELATQKARVNELQSQLMDARRRFSGSSAAVDTSVSVSKSSLSSSPEEEFLKLQLAGAESKLKDLKLEAAQLQDERRSAAQQYAATQLALGHSEERGAAAEKRVAGLEAQLANNSHQLSVLTREKQLWSEREQALMTQVATLQTDVEIAERKAGRGQIAQEELQKRLIEQVDKIEALVASKSGGSNIVADRVERAEQAEQESRAKAEEAEKKVAQLSTQIDSLNEQLSTLQNELKGKLDEFQHQQSQWTNSEQTLESEISRLKAENDKLHANLDEETAKAKLQAEKANARDEELVEQVNDLEDKLTEARLEADQMKQSQGSFKDELTKELTSKLTAELSVKIREEIEADMREKNNSADGDQGKTAAASDSEMLTEERHASLELELRKEIAEKLETELRQSLAPEVAASLRNELLPKISEDVRTQLEKEIGEQIKAERQGSAEKSTLAQSGITEAAPVDHGSSAANETPTQQNEHAAMDASLDNIAADDIPALRLNLIRHASEDAVSKFEAAVLDSEQKRVKDAFKQKLAAARMEAQQHGENIATKRSEIRTKLQNQKVAKLEQTNRDLEAQVEDLRNKVRRLKGGITEESETSTSEEQPQQQSFQPSQASPFQWPMPQPSAFTSAFGVPLNDPQKRPGSFEDSEPKKRKED